MRRAGFTVQGRAKTAQGRLPYRDRIRHKLDFSDGMELAHFATRWLLENG